MSWREREVRGRQERERVREVMCRSVGESWRGTVHALYFHNTSVEYYVRGRARDGDLADHRRFRRGLRRAGRVLLHLIALPVQLAIAVVLDDAPDFSSGPERSATVTGETECAALGLADVLRRSNEHLWIVYSDANLVLAELDEHEIPRILWSAEQGQRREFKNLRAKRLPAGPVLVELVLHWPDESRADLLLHRAETELLREREGTT